MTNLYTPMSLALQAHNNAYPQKFVLTDSALTTLNQVRKLVNESIASPLQSGWEREFMGVPLEIGPQTPWWVWTVLKRLFKKERRQEDGRRLLHEKR